jgi:type IV pilus assembly protein PilC
VVTAMELSENQQGLASTLETLSDMSQQQADMRLSVAHIVISPILLVFIAFIVGFVVIGLFMPLVNLMSSM